MIIKIKRTILHQKFALNEISNKIINSNIGKKLKYNNIILITYFESKIKVEHT